MKQLDYSLRSITFFFPYKEVSGVPVLFTRLAEHLATYSNRKIFIVDYIDGAMAVNTVLNDNITLIPFVDGSNIKIPENTTLVFQSFIPSRFRHELEISENTKVFFWTLHQDNLVPVLLPFYKFRNLETNSFWFYKTFVRLIAGNSFNNTSRLCQVALENRALYFMDKSTLSKTKKHLFRSFPSDNFLPVPSLGVEERRFEKLSSDSLSLGWIGRLCDFKSHVLIHTLKRVSEFAKTTRSKIVFHIVGDGPFYHQVSNSAEENEYFSLHMHKQVLPKDLNHFLMTKVDLLTAMGTSVLEGAKLGIPSIVVDISYRPILHEYRFRWLFDTEDYDLGHQISDEDFKDGKGSIEGMIKDVKLNFKHYSERSLRYFDSNHNIDTVANRLDHLIKDSSLKFGLIDKAIFRKSLSRKLYNKFKGIK